MWIMKNYIFNQKFNSNSLKKSINNKKTFGLNFVNENLQILNMYPC